MAADDPHEFLTPRNNDDDEEREARALEREFAAGEALRLANKHRKICSALHLRYADVTADDLARASLSDDPDIQCARLGPLFKMCGLIGVGHEIERADLINRLADAGLQSVNEMQVLSQAIATEYMAARFASDAMRQGQSFEVMSLQLGNFSKAAKLGTQLREAQHKFREAARPSLRLLDASPHAAIAETKSLPARASVPDPQSDTGEAERG